MRAFRHIAFVAVLSIGPGTALAVTDDLGTLDRCVGVAPDLFSLRVAPRGSPDCLAIAPATRELVRIGDPRSCVVIDGTRLGAAPAGSPACVRLDADLSVVRDAAGACLVSSPGGVVNFLVPRQPRDCLRLDPRSNYFANGEAGRCAPVSPAIGTPSPVGAVPPPGSAAVPACIRVAQPSGEWLLDERRPWAGRDQWSVRVGARWSQWDTREVSTGTLVDGAMGTEREAARSDDTIDTGGVDLRWMTPYGDFEVVYEQGDGSASAIEPVGGAQIGFVYHVPSATGSLGLNTGRTGGEFRIATDLKFIGGRYVFPRSLYRNDRDDCKIDLRAVLTASRLRTRYDAWQGNTSIPAIYSETRQEVEEDRFGAGVRGVYARRLSDQFVGRFELDLDVGYRSTKLESEQRNVCGASGCNPAATFTASVRDEDTGFAWGAGLRASLDYEITRNSRVSLSAGYRYSAESEALVNPVRTINFDGLPRLVGDDVATWSMGLAYRHRF